MTEKLHFLIAKYIPNVFRNEPRNIGIVLWTEETVLAQFAGEDANSPGKIHDGDIPSFVASPVAYKEWVRFWRRELAKVPTGPVDRIDPIRRTAPGNYLLADGGVITQTISATQLPSVLGNLFADYVMVPKSMEQQPAIPELSTHSPDRDQHWPGHSEQQSQNPVTAVASDQSERGIGSNSFCPSADNESQMHGTITAVSLPPHPFDCGGTFISRLVMSLLEAVGQAFMEKGRKALQGYITFGDALTSVAEQTLKELRKHMPADQIRIALASMGAMPAKEFDTTLETMLNDLCRVQSEPFRAELHEYLSFFPHTIRQMFHRPSDPAGLTAPERLDFYKPEQLLPFLPARRPHFKPGAKPEGLDHWELRELRGLGACGEVWLGHDDKQPEYSPAALKFAIEKESKKRIVNSPGLFSNVFELNDINGIVPLRSVYLESDPPCLEYAFVSGYDLSGLMHEWRWRFDQPKPQAALKLIMRIAEILGKAHNRGVVHRDLKPSNVLIHPTDGGKFTLWITDYGWGQIEAGRSLELHKIGGIPKPEQIRSATRGAYTPLYASPEQSKNKPATPTDDVHALGVIWYQLLKRDPKAMVPVGEEWIEEFLPYGMTRNQARLLMACVSVRPDRRPEDANEIVAQLVDEMVSVPIADHSEGSKVVALKRTGQDTDKLHSVGTDTGLLNPNQDKPQEKTNFTENLHSIEDNQTGHDEGQLVK